MSDKLDRIRKSLAKKNIMTEMNDPTAWLCTGNAAMNYRLSGRFDRGIPNRRSCLLWGESGTGKTFLTSNMALDAQRQGYTIIYLDSEESISEDYMEKIGISLDADLFMPILVDTIEDVTSVLSEIFSIMDKDEDKFIIIIDSLAGLLTEKEEGEFDKGVAKGEMGQFAKKIKLLVKNINKKISEFDAFCIMVTHAYQNQDLLNGEGRWICTGGKGFQFFPSVSIKLEKAKLKEGTEVIDGVRIKGEVTKTRFTAPFQKFELKVPYDSGLSFTDGFLKVLEEDGVVKRNGAWYSYDLDGEVVKFQAGKFEEHYETIMELYQAEDEPEETVDHEKFTADEE